MFRSLYGFMRCRRTDMPDTIYSPVFFNGPYRLPPATGINYVPWA